MNPTLAAMKILSNPHLGCINEGTKIDSLTKLCFLSKKGMNLKFLVDNETLNI